MKHRHIPATTIVVLSLSLVVAVARAAQDRYTLKAPNGIAFSEFRGYEAWQAVAPSQTDSGVKVILANASMIGAYQGGIPGNGKPFPDGSMIAKIEWAKTANPASPYAVNVPGALKSVSFIEKDSRRFPDTNGWGYAQFSYDAPSGTFKPVGSGSAFGKTECHVCHTSVKVNDYIFTRYAPR